MLDVNSDYREQSSDWTGWFRIIAEPGERGVVHVPKVVDIEVGLDKVYSSNNG